MKKLELKDSLFQAKPSELNSKVDKEMDEIVSKATSFDRNKRFSSSREFYKRLESYLDSHKEPY
jgi:hypothetical protein